MNLGFWVLVGIGMIVSRRVAWFLFFDSGARQEEWLTRCANRPDGPEQKSKVGVVILRTF